jgi:dTMP kinase
VENSKHHLMKQYKNFITFEGIDFCGKTTQVEGLINYLKESGVKVHLVREPGGTIISEKIRQILLDKSHREMHPSTEILLYSAARSQLTHQTIFPLLETEEYVIADRFFDSTTAYQGYGRNLDITFVAALNQFATSNLVPYKTFFIDILPEEAARRRKAAGRKSDRLESEDIRFYHAIREGYQKLAQQLPNRFITIAGNQPVNQIAQEIREQILQIWKLPASGK